MSFKSIVALFMGLVIQLSQAQSCVVAVSVSPTGALARPTCCCEGLQSCPCASDRGPEQKSAPLVPATVDLKCLVPQATGTNNHTAPLCPPTGAGVITAATREARWAYAGVPLSVAFCRFVI